MMEADKVLGPARLRPFYGLPSKDPSYKAPKLFKLMPYKLKLQAITWNSRCNPFAQRLFAAIRAPQIHNTYTKFPSFCIHHRRRHLLLRLLLPP
jgi:hypothetical protein